MSTVREALETAMAAHEDSAPEPEAPPVEPVEPEAPAEEPKEPTDAPATKEPVEPTETPKPEETKEAKAQRERDESGKFTKGKTSATKVVVPVAPTKTPIPKPGETSATKPPPGWKPGEHEIFRKLSPEAKEIISRREADMARFHNEVLPDRQLAQQVRETVSPYMGLIKSQGGDVLKTVDNLLQTAYALHTAPPQHKEGIVANLIRTFGIDPAGVAAQLTGQPGAQQQPQFDPGQFRQQLLQDFNQTLEQRQMSALTNHYKQQAEQFEASHEFMDDLREPMQKLLSSGLANNFEEAYARAASMHPEISAVLKQREDAKQANAARASTQRAKAASSSLKSSPAGPTANGSKGNDWRSVIERAYDEKAGVLR